MELGRGFNFIQHRPSALVAARLAREEEGLGGFHYDDRFMPFRSNRPLIADALPADFFSVDLATGAVGTTTGDHGLTHYLRTNGTPRLPTARSR